jgi:hypothetical protein
VRVCLSRAGQSLCSCLIGLMLFACGEALGAALALLTVPTATPTAITCDVSPRSTTEIFSLAEDGVREPIAALALPTVVSADPVITAAITAVLQEMATCLTAGDMRRFYALHSDDWLRRSLGVVEGMATQTISMLTLDDGNRARYLGPWHVQTLADSRVLAAVLLVVNDDLRPDPDRTTVLLFIHRDGRWLVDETITSVRVPDCALPVAVAAVVGPPPGTLFDSWAASCG